MDEHQIRKKQIIIIISIIIASAASSSVVMNFTLEDINSEVLHLYEKGQKLRKASGYHIYLRNAYRS